MNNEQTFFFLLLGEFQQLQNKSDDNERFQLYLNKTFNKTASLIAYRYYSAIAVKVKNYVFLCTVIMQKLLSFLT